MAGRAASCSGAHLGSFEVCAPWPTRAARCPGQGADVRRPTPALINQVLNALNPWRAAAVIPIGTDESLLRVKEALAQGELVGMLGDRITTGDKVVSVEFLGPAAPLPMGRCAGEHAWRRR